jgi:activator of 2-hydroxyglutaryl-CoA dehydratase
LEAALSCAVVVPSQPQYTGALGAAILAGRQSRARPLL